MARRLEYKKNTGRDGPPDWKNSKGWCQDDAEEEEDDDDEEDEWNPFHGPLSSSIYGLRTRQCRKCGKHAYIAACLSPSCQEWHKSRGDKPTALVAATEGAAPRAKKRRTGNQDKRKQCGA